MKLSIITMRSRLYQAAVEPKQLIALRGGHNVTFNLEPNRQKLLNVLKDISTNRRFPSRSHHGERMSTATLHDCVVQERLLRREHLLSCDQNTPPTRILWVVTLSMWLLSLGCYRGEILECFGNFIDNLIASGDVMPLHNIFWVVIGEPDLSFFVFIDKRLLR